MGRLALFLALTATLLSCASSARTISRSADASLLPDAPFRAILPEIVVQGKSIVHLKRVALRLGAQGRFWTNFPDTWDKIQIEPTSYRTAKLAQEVFEASSEPLEKFYACFYLGKSFQDSGIWERAIDSYREALRWMQNAVVRLELAWIYAMEAGDDARAIEYFPRGIGLGFYDVSDRDKWKFVRARLFYKTVDLTSIGLDNHVSTLDLDRDDVWIGTWGGGLARYSLIADEATVLLKPSTSIAPVRLVRTTKWFVYVFRDSILQRYSKVSQTWKEFSYPPRWGGLRVQDVAFLGEERFYVCHLGQGLFEWNEGTWIDTSPAVSSSFLNVFAKNADEYWIGSQDRGLFRWKPGSEAISIPGGPRNVTSIVVRPDGSIFVGTYGEGLWKRTNDRWTRIASEPAFVTSATQNSKRPAFGSLDEGVVLISDVGTTSLRTETGIPVSDVSTLVSWHDRIVWGTPESGLGIWKNDED